MSGKPIYGVRTVEERKKNREALPEALKKHDERIQEAIKKCHAERDLMTSNWFDPRVPEIYAYYGKRAERIRIKGEELRLMLIDLYNGNEE